jgi:proteic killer suppression protein
MIHRFRDQGTQDVFNGLDTKASRRTWPPEIWQRAQRRLSQLAYASSLADLRLPRSNRLHELVGDRQGQHSMSINMEYRICFVWTSDGPVDVEITDYH